MHGGSASVHLADVGSPVQIDLEKLFYHCIVGIGTPIAVALIDQELVIVQGGDFAHARTGREQVAKLVSRASRSDVNGDDTKQFGRGAAVIGVLDQSVLHDAHQGAAIWGDRQTL